MPTNLKDREQNPAGVPDYGRDPSADNFDDIIGHSFSPAEQQALKDKADSGMDKKGAGTGGDSGESSTDSSAGTLNSRSDNENRSFGDRMKSFFGKGSFTKKRAKYALITAIIGAIGGGGLFVAPNFAIIHLKEALMDDFNYARDAASDAQLKIMGKQLGQQTTRCVIEAHFCQRFSGFSKRQVKAFETNNVTFKGVKQTIAGRSRPTIIVFEGREYSALEFSQALNRKGPGKDMDPAEYRRLVAAVRAGFQPRWVTLSSKAFDKVRARHNASKEPLAGDTQKEVNENVNGKIKAANDISDDGQGFTRKEDGTYVGPNGQPASEEAVKGLEELRETKEELSKVNTRSIALNSVANTAWSAVNIAGAGTAVCATYGYMKMTAMGLKIIQARAFFATAWNAILRSADSLKLGMGNLVAVSLASGARLFTPDKAGNTAFETPHYESMINKVPRRNFKDSEKTTYGAMALGMAGKVLTSALNVIKRYTGNKPDSTCKVVQNPWVQGTGLVAGLALAFFTGGGSSLANASITASVQLALGVALAALIPTIMGIVENNLVNEATVGGSLMIAGYLGTKVMHSENAQSTAMRPESKPGAAANIKHSLAIARERAEDERLIHKPWDISSPHTLAGSTLRNLAPKVASVRSGLSLTTLPGKLLGSISSGMNTKALADDGEYARWRANECQEDFSPNLATGPDCEVEYKTYTDIDPEENAIWLEDNGFIDGEGNFTDKARGDEGGNYFKDCVDRTAPIGLSNDTTTDTGNKCIDGQGGDHEALFDRFAAHGVAFAVIDGMDNEPNPSLNANQSAESGGATGGTGTAAADVKAFKRSMKGKNGRINTTLLCSVDFAQGHKLYCGAATMLKQVNAAYKAKFNKDICITDSYRTYEEQVRLKLEKPNLAADAGTSNHGWGTALDLCGGIENYNTPEHQWLAANGPQYGWFLPWWAKEKTGTKKEPWHFEFRGIGGSAEDDE